jgi:pectate lyase
MKINNKLVCALTLVTAAFFLNGCSSGDDNGDNSTDDGNTTPVTINSTIKLTDTPAGYASLGTSYTTSGTQTVVTTRAELLSALSKGGIIIVDGMIDMSEGKLWASGSNSMSTAATAMDTFVNSVSTSGTYTSYADWVDKYTAACAENTEDGDSTAPSGAAHSSLYSDLWKLNKAYGNLIKITLNSNTTLVGKNENSGIRGGSIQISGKSNIQIRNLIIQDSCDPFPHHEVSTQTVDGVKTYKASDGYNAQWDGICIQGSSSNIWIDHCTFEDTIKLAYTTNTTKEKWQIYDGLCDMKGECTNITVSNCIFKNHDKTMLIGSDDSDGNNTKRFVTLTGNYFWNCGQRLPMVRNTTIHIYNNYYDSDSSKFYSNSYAVGCRKNCIVYAENNYFGSGIQYSFKDSYCSLYANGNKDNSSAGRNTDLTGSTLFSAATITDSNGASRKYTYTALSASAAKAYVTANAGAGCTLGE